MTDETPRAATVEELTRRCGHECLLQPDHDGIHQYGYIGGPYSYEGRLRRIAELESRIRGLKIVVEAFGVEHTNWSVSQPGATVTGSSPGLAIPTEADHVEVTIDADVYEAVLDLLQLLD